MIVPKIPQKSSNLPLILPQNPQFLAIAEKNRVLIFKTLQSKDGKMYQKYKHRKIFIQILFE